MRKEVLIAIIFGFTLGLLIVGGIWWSGQIAQKPSKTSVSENQPEDLVEPEDLEDGQDEESAVFLEISYPEEGAIIDSDEVKVAGETIPAAVVVLIYPEGETIVTADDEGKFEGTVGLSGGANEIKITAYDYQGNKEEALLTIVYSTAKL